MSEHSTYVSPFSQRYASKEMQYLFSDEKKFKTWRRLWLALAESEKETGLYKDGEELIDEQMLKELRDHLDDIDYETAQERERITRHDVMAQVYAYGRQCPKAAGIIHLGATSAYVKDNTDLIVMREALLLLRKKLLNVISLLAKFADEYKDLPTLAYTHFQPAQPTTVGKRAALWLNDFVDDLEDLDHVTSSLKLLGCKGTTGSQASFMELFENDEEKIRKIDQLIAAKMGFAEVYPLSSQTYSRKVDMRISNVLAAVAASAMKFATDLRLLSHLKEIEEPYEKKQIGSSAMPYKHNPMRCERICSLSRYILVDVLNESFNASSQWLERTLDDSANRRISLAEAFLAGDGILDLCINVADGLIVYPQMIEKHLQEELPFMASENILMAQVKKGGDRQYLHEQLRELANEAGRHVKLEGKDNDLLELISASGDFSFTKEELQETLRGENYTGRCSHQVSEYLSEVVWPLLEENKDDLGMKVELQV